MIRAMLRPRREPAKALIAPHAGWVYSGEVAGHAYARLSPEVTRVVILAPAHRVAFRGIAAPSVDAFETPLGTVPLDRAALEGLPVIVRDDVHRDEHAIEVHLPFLQEVLDDFCVVPLVVGAADAGEVATVLEALWGGDETCVLVSSDLSHFHDYETARALDDASRRAIEVLDGDALDRESACGRLPIQGLLRVVKARGLQVETLDVRNSGDTAGTKDRVVGYGAWAFA